MSRKIFHSKKEFTDYLKNNKQLRAVQIEAEFEEVPKMKFLCFSTIKIPRRYATCVSCANLIFRTINHGTEHEPYCDHEHYGTLLRCSMALECPHYVGIPEEAYLEKIREYNECKKFEWNYPPEPVTTDKEYWHTEGVKYLENLGYLRKSK